MDLCFLPQVPVYTRFYLDAFNEFIILLNQFGTTMAFVVNGLRNTIEAMEFHLSSSKGSYYEQVDKMICYEIKHKLIQKQVEFGVVFCTSWSFTQPRRVKTTPTIRPDTSC